MKPQLHIRRQTSNRLLVYLFAVMFFGMQELDAGLNPEYRAKLACLYKLASYIEHPGGEEQPHIRIGVLGKDPFGPALDSMAADHKAHGKSVVVARFRTPEEYTACDILFMGRDVGIPTLRQIASSTKAQCVLIVGEHPEFTANGGAVNLTLKDNGKAAIQLNLDAAHARGLRIDARLLKVCQIVDAGVSRP